MAKLSAYELRYLAMLDELKKAPEVTVYEEERGPLETLVGDASTAFKKIAEWEGISLDPALQRCFIRFEGLSSHWGIELAGMHLRGEFSIRHIAAAMLSVGVDLATEDTPEEDRLAFSELRVFDEHLQGGGGSLAGLRIQPGMTSPEVWYYEGTHSIFKLDLDYAEYLDTLLVTKGTYGWQYLFAADSTQDNDFQDAAENMQNMLSVFPNIFPEHDYEPLQERLTQRLR
ncbi:hypothetical protein AB0I10_09090 [Streptomyces sp. NPDC050636]|uniref:hypothetical protein n=1 Tax=Streptomyces sp. NPDC050636 TaxID=3154510 RepID=UPI003434DF5E